MRILKLYILVNNQKIYELNEEEPLLLEQEDLPVTIQAKNGYHFSKPFILTDTKYNPIFIRIGCIADNGRFWGSILISSWLFILYYITDVKGIIILANLPLLYLIYHFFWYPRTFITIHDLKKK